MKGGENISGESKKDIRKLLVALIDGMGDLTKTTEYRRYIKNHGLFIYPPDVMAQIKAHDPAYSQVTTPDIWQRTFKRVPKRGAKPFFVNTKRYENLALLDISQTTGKQVPFIYQNVSGKVEHFLEIRDCLANYSDLPVFVQERSGYYSGIGQDSFVENGKIILRPALSELQTIFALVREIIRQNQTTAAIVEAAGYMVCRYFEIDTSEFTFGYLLELLNFDESLHSLKNTRNQETIISEAEILIGFLRANLPFKRNNSDGEAILEIEEKPSAVKTPQKPIKHSDDRIENVYGIDFRFIKIIKEFMSIRPDKSISARTVKEYSYFDENMFIIGNTVAVNLFSKGKEIYILHKDNTEERAESLADINRHYGLFGIEKNDWLTMQAEMAKIGLDNERVKIDRLGQIAVRELNRKKGGRRISENVKDAADNAEAMQFTEAGICIVVADDIDHKAVENPAWVKPALTLILDGGLYKRKDIPYFVKQGDDEPSYDMKKINKIMTHYCAVSIPKVLSKCVVEKNGQKTCEVTAAVRHMCENFNTEHIARALEEYWTKLKIPFAIKKQFNEQFERLRKKYDVHAKKPTPDESMRRVTAISGENAQEGKSNPTKEELELMHIIENYKRIIVATPKQAPKAESIIPPLSAIQTKTR